MEPCLRPTLADLGPVVGFACPALGGDLLALTRRRIGLLRASLFSTAAACAAGLRNNPLHSRQTVFGGVPPAVAWALARLMRVVTNVRPGCWRVAGAPTR